MKLSQRLKKSFKEMQPQNLPIAKEQTTLLKSIKNKNSSSIMCKALSGQEIRIF